MVLSDTHGVVGSSQKTTYRQDSLASSIAQLQKARGNAQESSGMTEKDEHDHVFLCGFVSDTSFVGHMDDRDSITDEELEDFIRLSNPEMFQRLFRGQKSFAKGQIQNGHPGYDIPMSTAKLATKSTNHGVGFFNSTPKFHNLQHVLLQVKRLILSSLLSKSAYFCLETCLIQTGGHVLVLQKLAVPHHMRCDHPYCQFKDMPIPLGSFILQMRQDAAPPSRQFCLGCIESLFSCRAVNAMCPSSLPLAPVVAFDGVKEVVEAAEKLVRPLPKTNCVNGTILSPPKPHRTLHSRAKGHASIQNYFMPDSPFEYPSNSPQALSLRRRRNAEIDDILADVEKYDKRRQDDVDHPLKSPLLITPPPQMPGEDRYKKQGLRRGDKEKEKHAVDRRDTSSASSGTTTESAQALSLDRICKCRDFSQGLVLRCGAEFCPTGLFHLECTGMLQKPAANLVWTCSDCSGLPEGSLVAAELSDEGEELELDDQYGDDNDYVYDDHGDDDEEELNNEDPDSHDYLLLTDRSMTESARGTSFSDESCDGDHMPLVADMEVASYGEYNTTRKAVEPVNAFTFETQITHEEPTTPPKHIKMATSFTPINLDRKRGTDAPSSIFPFDGGTGPVLGNLPGHLPTGWSDITFEDLAPFIIAETNVMCHHVLATEYIGMLEEWRDACPVSRLASGERLYGHFRVKNVVTASLSHLLAMVEVEMAGR